MSTSTLPPRTAAAPREAETVVDPVEPDAVESSKPVLTLSVTALAAGALAAVTSATIGSTLGTAGTLTGAALGSIVGALSTALYTFGLQRTWHALAALNPRRAQVAAGVLFTAFLAFLVALGAITSLEKATGSSLAGAPGTTLQQVRVVTVERAAAVPGPDRQVAAPVGAAQPAASEAPVGAAEPSVAPVAEPTTPPSAEPGVPPAPDPGATPAPTAPGRPSPTPVAPAPEVPGNPGVTP